MLYLAFLVENYCFCFSLPCLESLISQIIKLCNTFCCLRQEFSLFPLQGLKYFWQFPNLTTKQNVRRQHRKSLHTSLIPEQRRAQLLLAVIEGCWEFLFCFVLMCCQFFQAPNTRRPFTHALVTWIMWQRQRQYIWQRKHNIELKTVGYLGQG